MDRAVATRGSDDGEARLGGLQGELFRVSRFPGRPEVGLRSQKAAQTSDVIRAIDFAVANKSTFGIDIINLSLGHPIYEPAATDPGSRG